MTRTKKIELIKKFRPSLYIRLNRQVPTLLEDPDYATPNEIIIYNNLIREEARNEENPAFEKNFSF